MYIVSPDDTDSLRISEKRLAPSVSKYVNLYDFLKLDVYFT